MSNRLIVSPFDHVEACMDEATCKTEVESRTRSRKELAEVSERIIADSESASLFTHIDFEPLPSKLAVSEIIVTARDVLFPGYFSRGKVDPSNARYYMGQKVSELYDLLADQITRHIRHECLRNDLTCQHCEEQGQGSPLAGPETASQH